MASYEELAGRIIVVEANIATGKTTACKSFSRFLTKRGRPTFFFNESIPPKLLKLYLSDKKRYAFDFQTIVARDRKQIFKEAIRLAKQGNTIIIDRGLLGDHAFAYMQKEKGFFTPQEYEVYLELAKPDTDLHDPSIIHTFLDCTPEVSFERMLKRGIPEEVESYNIDYFRSVYKAHCDILKAWVKRVDWNPSVPVEEGYLKDEVCEEFFNVIISDR